MSKYFRNHNRKSFNIELQQNEELKKKIGPASNSHHFNSVCPVMDYLRTVNVAYL